MKYKKIKDRTVKELKETIKNSGNYYEVAKAQIELKRREKLK